MKYAVFSVLMLVSTSIFCQVEVLSNNRVQIGANPFTSDWMTSINNKSFNLGLQVVTKPFTGNSSPVIGFRNYLQNGTNVLKTGIFNESYQASNSNKMHKGIESQTYLFGQANGSASMYALTYVDNSSYGSKYGMYSLIRNFGTSSGTGPRYAIYGENQTGSGYAGFFHGDVYIMGSLTIASDLSLKTEVQEIPDIKERFLQIAPKQYKLLAEDKDLVHYGFIAQQVEELFPELVVESYVPGSPIVERTEDKDGNQVSTVVGEEEGTIKKGVNYIEVVPLLVEMIQDQQKVITDLTKRIETLENK